MDTENRQNFLVVNRWVSFHAIGRRVRCNCNGEFQGGMWDTKLGSGDRVTRILDPDMHIRQYYSHFFVEGLQQQQHSTVEVRRYSNVVKRVFCKEQ
jgi:hypothetical protein